MINILYKFLYFILCNFYLLLVDNFIGKKLNHRWFCVHAFGNLIVTFTSLLGFFYSLDDPVNAMNPLVHIESNKILSSASPIPICMINAIHFYHVLRFNINNQDIFHHFLFGIFIGLPGIYYNWGAIRNFLCFSICGLPGLIDYTNLLLVKQNLMLKQTQKYICSLLNCWIRAPLIVIYPFMTYIFVKNFETTIPLPFIFLVNILAFFNGMYYLQSSIRSEERYNFILKKNIKK